ncbi:hypothetical protein [Paenibacillus sp. GXUN7292]|uniref:hypothetical protein n=1 Tax=Paenibacillus sp. GXUN7292 TaxID=3422499 RepID=UPI003D7C62F5
MSVFTASGLLEDEVFQQTACSLYWHNSEKVKQLLRHGAEQEGLDPEHELWAFIKVFVERFRKGHFAQFYNRNRHLYHRNTVQKVLTYDLAKWDKSTSSLLPNCIQLIYSTCQCSSLPHDLLEQIVVVLEDELVEAQEEYKSFRPTLTNETFERLYNEFCFAGDLDILVLCMGMGDREGVAEVFQAARLAFWRSLEERKGCLFTAEKEFAFRGEPSNELTYLQILKGLRMIDQVFTPTERSTLPDWWKTILDAVRHSAIKELV